MEPRMVTITAKGQISIPVSVQRAARLKQGDRMIVAFENDAVVLRKANKVKQKEVTPKFREPSAFLGAMKGSNLRWNKEEDAWYGKD